MAETSLTQKLLIKPGVKALVVNAPDGFLAALTDTPDTARVQSATGAALSASAADHPAYDVVLLFVRSKAELDAHAGGVFDALREGGVLWISYPKKSGKIKTDINRDQGWDAVSERDFLGVTQISVDDTWSALRFRPRAEIKTLTRKF
jgi:hypothetical protein